MPFLKLKKKHFFPPHLPLTPPAHPAATPPPLQLPAAASKVRQCLQVMKEMKFTNPMRVKKSEAREFLRKKETILFIN